MVSVFLSYHAGDDTGVGRLLDDMLTARFGTEGVVRDEQSATLSTTELRRRLAASAALIDVLDPAAPKVLRQTFTIALTTSVPVVVVLVDDAHLAPNVSAQPTLSTLAVRRSEVRTATLRRTIRRLCDQLATRQGSEEATVGPTIPLILRTQPVRQVMSPASRHPSVTIVYSTHQGGLEVADVGRHHSGLASRYETRYEVDTSVHQRVFGLRLPASGGAGHVESSIAVDVWVTDAVQVVQGAVTDAAVVVREILLGVCRPILSRCTVDELSLAETALNRQLATDTFTLDGVTVRVRHVLLFVDDRARVGERAEQRRRERLRRAGVLWDDADTPDALVHYRSRRVTLSDEYAGGWAGATPPIPGPKASPPPITAPQTSPPPTVTQVPTRLLVARAPTRVPAGQDLSVEVRLVTEGRSVHPGGRVAPMPGLIVADGGTPVTVTVHGPAGLHADGPLQQTVLVLPDDDPDPIRFGFAARTTGLHRVDVTAWAGGTFLAEVSVEVSVADGGPFRDGQPRVAALGAPQARPGEVTLEVRFDGSRHTFQLRSDVALFAPVVESVTNAPNAAVEHTIRELQQLAGGGSRYSPAMTREVIRSAGIQLWSELVPADVRDQFWEVRADMSAFTIATDHDVVPWELLHPLSAQQDEGFLVEQVPVVRRTYGQHRNAKIGLRNPRFVVPPKAPTGAYEEVTTIRAILGAADSEPITRADELLALINSGELGATHFACHNTFSSDGSFIDLDGGRFKPALLAEASIRKALTETGPLVFINACRSAGVAPTYTRMLGWAQQFMSSGAGAFVGTLWAVRSDSSARFATAFYESLAGGATLGAAALAARVGQQDDPLDPTWLAYTVYGDPFATAAV
ncbi:CHAT domain-containing protein [Micromonospora chokoriensis]|uniref:CHAT domain-containing protein n=1 Tax=Micromonospora chokoriensis TaxID=356851 RepID=A0A1C4YC69_9ACTN|nr:CHAT domain-containing protein [Micromonospora chokoriensis]SCF18226.1 CHAT domain-containing protein [Micromonospora chokoriensis]